MLRALDAGEFEVSGDRALFRRFVETLDSFQAMFNVVEP
jgi:alkyl sulfatase BDS1-like metallo-beta-lactamase superfamily hydrolase